MKSTTVTAAFKEQLRQLFSDLKHISKKHFGEKHDIVHAAKDLFEMALIESRPIMDSSCQTTKQKAELKESSKDLTKEIEFLKQELQQLKKNHQTVMKAQKAKYEQLKETFSNQKAELNRLNAEVKTKCEKLASKQQFISNLYLENTELKEEVEKLTEEKGQLNQAIPKLQKLQLNKTHFVQNQETQRFQTSLIDVLETWV